MGEKGEEGLDREAIMKKRKEAISNIQKCVAQYEQQLQQNPNEAEESFDRSVSMKRFRVTSESIMNSSFKGNNTGRNASATIGQTRN